jgi:type IV secretory pathway VirB4 component
MTDESLVYLASLKLEALARAKGRDPFMLMVELVIKLHPDDVRKWLEEQTMA